MGQNIGCQRLKRKRSETWPQEFLVSNFSVIIHVRQFVNQNESTAILE